MIRVEPEEAVEEARRAGRPRDARLDDAIKAATFDLIRRRGYNGLSIKAVAEAAGTTTPTIYRRWPSKAELVLELVFRTDGPDVVAESGDLEADVTTMIRWSLEKLGDPVGRAALAGLLGEPRGDGSGLQHRLVGVWQHVGDRLRRAVDAGELRDDVDVEQQVLSLVGPAILAAVVFGRRVVSDEWARSLAVLALDGMRPLPAANDTGTGTR